MENHQKQKSKLLQLGEYEEALKYIDQALNCNPNSAYRLYLKGECLICFIGFNPVQSQQRYKEAILYYDKSLQIDPNWGNCKNAKAKCEKQINNCK